jgi:hypothetical protein
VITGSNQAGCTAVSAVGPNGKTYRAGAVFVPVSVKNHNTGGATYFVDVQCAT